MATATEHATTVLTLPLPPSPNRWPSHPIVLQREKDRYRAEAWVAAYRQRMPPLDPPRRVRIRARFYVPRHQRDPDNLTASLKWVFDALRQKQQGGCRWRNGIGELRGYFVDDDPAHLELEGVDQYTDRRAPRLVLTIEPIT